LYHKPINRRRGLLCISAKAETGYNGRNTPQSQRASSGFPNAVGRQGSKLGAESSTSILKILASFIGRAVSIGEQFVWLEQKTLQAADTGIAPVPPVTSGSLGRTLYSPVILIFWSTWQFLGVEFSYILCDTIMW